MIESLLHILRVQNPTTAIFDPLFDRSTKKIEVDITYQCNLKCVNCNRSCQQTASYDHMIQPQIQKFIKETIANNYDWQEIRILGGEPTLHPQILGILNRLIHYKFKLSPYTKITLCTNGKGIQTKKIIKKIPHGINIENSNKKNGVQLFQPFNMAPIDDWKYKFADFTNGCAIMKLCGMGLNKYGYYYCAIAGGIDRIIGLDIGLKKMPPTNDKLLHQMKNLCKLCGHFKHKQETNKELISKSWNDYYSKYSKQKPKLTKY